MRTRRPPRYRVCALVTALAFVSAAACSDDTGTTGAAPSTTVAAALGATSTTTTIAITGDPVNQFTFVPGDCFNRYEVGTDVITTKVPCEGPHQREVYSTVNHPAPFGEPWPGDEALQRYGSRLCYQSFETFVGVIYELSELGIGVLTPPRVNWEDARARYRGITCYLTRNDSRPLVGSMRGKAV